jgi:hypothetical protein
LNGAAPAVTLPGVPTSAEQLQQRQLALRAVEANQRPLGPLIAYLDGAKIHKREWDAPRSLYFGEHGILMARTSRWNASIAGRKGHDDIPGSLLRALPEFADRVAGPHPENRLIPIESVIDARYHDRGMFRNTSLALALADGSQLTFRWAKLWMLLPEIEQIAW